MKLSHYSDLDIKTKQSLNKIIDEEFGHIPIVKETEWATPDWTIIQYSDNEIASFYNIVERNVNFGSGKIKVAGINNVITKNKYRGQHLAFDMLKESQNQIFDCLKSGAGLLLCADSLVPFYEKLGWYKVDCPVYFHQENDKKKWGANTMLLTPNFKLFPEYIDLNGLPW